MYMYVLFFRLVDVYFTMMLTACKGTLSIIFASKGANQLHLIK